MRSTFKTDEDKESFGHYKLILGPKMAYFWPQNCVFGLFWDNWRYCYTFSISKMDRIWHTRSTFRAEEDKNSFKHSWLMPSIIPKLAKKAVFGAKMGHFRPQNESGVFETVFIYFSPKSWSCMPSSIHFGYWKV